MKYLTLFISVIAMIVGFFGELITTFFLGAFLLASFLLFCYVFPSFRRIHDFLKIVNNSEACDKSEGALLFLLYLNIFGFVSMLFATFVVTDGGASLFAFPLCALVFVFSMLFGSEIISLLKRIEKLKKEEFFKALSSREALLRY